jgi:flagellar basal-body rod modification protein FlgD
MIDNVQSTAPDPWSQAYGEVKAPDPNQGLASKETFLQLLVAQIRHQDPLAPSDGIQFLSQLAQFSGLEQTIEMRRELEAIHGLLDAQATKDDAEQAGGSGTTSDGTTETGTDSGAQTNP